MKQRRPNERWINRLAAWIDQLAIPTLILFLALLSLAVAGETRVSGFYITDGAHVIWTEVENDQYAMYLADPGGSNKHRVTTVDYRTTSNQLMALSPDDSLIAYVVSAEDDRADSRIWSVSTNGSGKTTLLAEPSDDSFPTNPVWSPNGDRIAFIRAGRGKEANLELWVMAPDGSQKQLITDSSLFKPDISFLGKAYSLFWAPDGFIYFHNERRVVHNQIDGLYYRIDVDRGNIGQVKSVKYERALKAARQRRLLAPAGFRLPFVGVRTITTGPTRGKHQGALNGEAIDFDLNYQEVIASEQGVIRYDYESCGGNQIKLEHPNGLVSHYAHLSAREPNNTSVGKGCKVGVSGASGSPDCVEGAHLHFAVLRDGTSIWIRDLPGITWYTGDINNPCMPYPTPDGSANGPSANCQGPSCCLCSSLNYSSSETQAVEEKPSPLSTIAPPSPAPSGETVQSLSSIVASLPEPKTAQASCPDPPCTRGRYVDRSFFADILGQLHIPVMSFAFDDL